MSKLLQDRLTEIAAAAAWAAARDAARAAIAPTVLALQASANDLLERMVAIGPTEMDGAA